MSESANFGLMHCSGTADRRAQLLAARLGKFAQRTPKITSIFKVRAHRKLPRARIQQAQLDKCAVTHASAALRVVQPRPPVAETGARVQLFDAARLLPRSRKTPAMGHAWATSMPHLRRDGHDAPDDAPDRIGRDGRARVGAPPSACGEERSAAVGVLGVRPGRVGVARDQAVLEAVRIDAVIVGPGLSEGTSRRGEEDRERRRSNGLDGHVSSPLFRARTIASLNAKWGQPRETVGSRCCQCCQIALADYHVGVRRTSPINTSSSRSRDPRSFGRHGRKTLGRRPGFRRKNRPSRLRFERR